MSFKNSKIISKIACIPEKINLIFEEFWGKFSFKKFWGFRALNTQYFKKKKGMPADFLSRAIY